MPLKMQCIHHSPWDVWRHHAIGLITLVNMATKRGGIYIHCDSQEHYILVLFRFQAMNSCQSQAWSHP